MSRLDLPVTKFSSQTMEGIPYNSNLSNYTGYVYGGPSLGTSDNFRVLYKWEYIYDRITSTLKVWREDLPDEAKTVFDDIENIYELSFCFNKTMDFVVAYVVKEGTFLRVYNPLSQSYESVLYEDAITPKVALSSVHTHHASDTEIIFGYVKPSTQELCIRLERDRYEKEIIVKKFERKAKLVNISFADTNRFQYEVLEAL